MNTPSNLNPGQYIIDTRTGPITVLLEQSPSLGNNYTFLDMAGSWAMNNFTINGNGTSIQGMSTPLVCDTVGALSFTLIYNGTTWSIN